MTFEEAAAAAEEERAEFLARLEKTAAEHAAALSESLDLGDGVKVEYVIAPLLGE